MRLGLDLTLMACSHGLKTEELKSKGTGVRDWLVTEAEDMTQLRHPSTTLSHPYKNHTTSEPVLTLPPLVHELECKVVWIANLLCSAGTT